MGFWSWLGWLAWIYDAYAYVRDSFAGLGAIWKSDADFMERATLSVENHGGFLGGLFLIITGLILLTLLLLSWRWKQAKGLVASAYIDVAWTVLAIGAFMIVLGTFSVFERSDRVMKALKLGVGSMLYGAEALAEAVSEKYADIPTAVIARLNTAMKDAYLAWLRLGAELAAGSYAEDTVANQQRLEDVIRPSWEVLKTVQEKLDEAAWGLQQYTGEFIHVAVENRRFLGLEAIIDLQKRLLKPLVESWREGFRKLQNAVPRVREAMESARQDPRMLTRLLVTGLEPKIEASPEAILPTFFDSNGTGFTEAIRTGASRAVSLAEFHLNSIRRNVLLLAGFILVILLLSVYLSHAKSSAEAREEEVDNKKEGKGKSKDGGTVQWLIFPLSFLVAGMAWKGWTMKQEYASNVASMSEFCSEKSGEEGIAFTLGDIVVSTGSIRAFQRECKANEKNGLVPALIELTAPAKNDIIVPVIRGIGVDRGLKGLRIEWNKLAPGTNFPGSWDTLNITEGDLGTEALRRQWRRFCERLRVASSNASNFYREIEGDLEGDVEGCQRGAKQSVFNAPLKTFLDNLEPTIRDFADLHDHFRERFYQAATWESDAQRFHLNYVLERLRELHTRDLAKKLEEIEKTSRGVCAIQGTVLERLRKDKLKADMEPRLKAIEDDLVVELKSIIGERMGCADLADAVEVYIRQPACSRALPEAQAIIGALGVHFWGLIVLAIGMILTSRIIDLVLRMVWRWLLAWWVELAMKLVVRTLQLAKNLAWAAIKLPFRSRGARQEKSLA